MEFRYSKEVDSSCYETRGLGGGIPLRTHENSLAEVKGTLQAQRDWSRYVRPVGEYRGGLGGRYSMICVTIPECLPDRLEVVSYANEFALLYDDEMEKLDLQSPPSSREILEVFGDDALENQVDADARPEKRLQARLFSRMLAIDSARAAVAMKAWAASVQLAARTRLTTFATLDEYIPARVVDVGELIWFGMVTFGMALSIPPEEHDLCMELARPAYIALGLTNDLFSWEKEREAARRGGQDRVFNAIWVLMNERGVSEEGARTICSEEIQKQVTKYCVVVEETKANLRLSRDLRTYIEALLYSISGNLVWSIHNPRYGSI
ncbi:terpenoid synthase [Durotheca rogersii]|uniref:terpenoid synthase n=1 Tax=Durotheca rogersii TaxID=419775 RepID=UPI00222029BA|nr:terpenoid synthase [Durotheca rogersii]KAI5866412.1 terpenoid synthase [Durotheca rogersii]